MGAIWAALAVALALVAFFLSPDQTVVLPLVAAIMGGIAALPAWLAFSYLTDAYGGQVAWLAAPLKEHSVHSRSGYTYYLDIGPLKRRVSYRTFVSVPTGTHLRCYHAPGTGRVLSLELASEPAPSGGLFAIPHPDAWNRLRTLQAIALVGILVALVGVREWVGAHPTEAKQFAGVATYYVSHGSKGSVSYYLSVTGSSDYLFRESPFELQPPIDSPDAEEVPSATRGYRLGGGAMPFTTQSVSASRSARTWSNSGAGSAASSHVPTFPGASVKAPSPPPCVVPAK